MLSSSSFSIERALQLFQKEQTVNSKTSGDDVVSYRVTRHFYSDSMRVEQSMDIYQPYHGTRGSTEDMPIIILVMGSGWLGHAWWLYSVFNWWNASGPKTIASLGYTCISIRHSGAFLSKFGIFFVAAVGAGIEMLRSKQQSDSCALGTPTYVWVFFALLVLLYLQGRGAATLEEMVHDVETATRYIQQNSEEILRFKSNFKHGRRKIILGGYSSGGHVVATLLSQRTAESYFSQNTAVIGILYLSGVLSLNCRAMNLITSVVFGRCHIPSPLGSRPPCLSVPHLMVGCEKELFGIPLLDGALCAQQYHTWLQEDLGYTSKCVLVQNSNHWSILSSGRLRLALEEHLPWLLQQYNANTNIIQK